MDYDSAEEGDEGDEEGGNNGMYEEELDDAEEKAPGALEESTHKKSRSSKVELQNLDLQQNQSRVNTVLQSNAAVESYRYDVEHELWCEVSARLYQVLIGSPEPGNNPPAAPDL